jgi:hypothetical protein
MKDEMRRKLQVAMVEAEMTDGDLMPFLLDHVDELSPTLQNGVDHVLDGHDDGSALDALLRAYDVSVYDVIPEFGSYIGDVEVNLADDSESWRKYNENPRPFIVDVLLDFGLWEPFDTNPAVVRMLAQRAADRYWNPA